MERGPLAAVLSAVCMSLAACGGGNDAAAPPLSNATGAENSAGTGNPTGASTPVSSGEPTSPPVSASTGTGTTGDGSGATSGGDASLPLLKLINDQIVFSGTIVTLEQIAASPGASGSTGLLFPRSAEAPLTSFGFRPQSNNRPTATGDTHRVSILLSLTQRPDTVPAGRTAQKFQFELDQVDMVINADHDVLKVSFPQGAQAWIYFKDGAGEEVNASTAAVTQDLVTLQPIADDTTSDYLSFNVQTVMQNIFAAAAGTPKQPVLAAISSMSGTFDVTITISGVVMDDENLVALPTSSVTLANSTLPAVTGPTMSGAIDIVAQ